MDEGAIEIDSIETIGFPDITPELARESGFLGVLDLLNSWDKGPRFSEASLGWCCGNGLS
jgi:hypothetical protein